MHGSELCVTIRPSGSYLFTTCTLYDPVGDVVKNFNPRSYLAFQVHLAFSLPAGAVTYVDEEGDKVSLDSEGE